jgi:predicted SAM-dependent methyltransferase
VKKLILNLIKSLGYKLSKIEPVVNFELELYKRLYPKESLDKKRFYNIGAGSFYHPYWTNIDYDSDWYNNIIDNTVTKISYDLFSLEKLPIDDNCAEIVYTSHTIEHINNSAAQNLFNESFRILKKDGIFRATTPNIDIEYRAYKENDIDYFFWIDNYSTENEMTRININKPMNQASIEQMFIYHFAAGASTLHKDGSDNRVTDEEFREKVNELGLEGALNYCTGRCSLVKQSKYPGNHINWWNKNKLFKMLQEAGFKNIYLSAYGQSYSAIMRNTHLFDNTHPRISIYIEAKK